MPSDCPFLSLLSLISCLQFYSFPLIKIEDRQCLGSKSSQGKTVSGVEAAGQVKSSQGRAGQGKEGREIVYVTCVLYRIAFRTVHCTSSIQIPVYSIIASQSVYHIIIIASQSVYNCFEKCSTIRFTFKNNAGQFHSFCSCFAYITYRNWVLKFNIIMVTISMCTFFTFIVINTFYIIVIVALCFTHQ